MLNKNWTERCGNAYIAEAIAYSEHGNNTTIYTVGHTTEEANAKLIAALRELKLMTEVPENETQELLLALAYPPETSGRGLDAD